MYTVEPAPTSASTLACISLLVCVSVAFDGRPSQCMLVAPRLKPGAKLHDYTAWQQAAAETTPCLSSGPGFHLPDSAQVTAMGSADFFIRLP